MNIFDALLKVEASPESVEARVHLAQAIALRDRCAAEEVWLVAGQLALVQGLFFQAISIARTHLGLERRLFFLHKLALRFGKDRFQFSASTLFAESSVWGGSGVSSTGGLGELQGENSSEVLLWENWREGEADPNHPSLELACQLGSSLPVGFCKEFARPPTIPLFSELSVLEFVLVANYMECLHVQPSEVLIEQGQISQNVFLLAEGSVCVTQTRPNGEVLILAEAQSPAVLGEMALLTKLPRRATVSAVTKGVVWRIEASMLEALQSQDSELIQALQKQVQRRLMQNLVQANPMLDAFFANTDSVSWNFWSFRQVAPGEEVVFQNQEQPGLFVLLHGAAEVWLRGKRGEEKCINQMAEGDIFGEQSLLLGHPAGASVRMPQGGLLFHLSVESYRSLCVKFPEIRQSLESLQKERKAQDKQSESVQTLLYPLSLEGDELFEEIMPYAKEGFWEELRKQPFFWPSFFSVCTGLMLFFMIEAVLHSRNSVFAYTYEFFLGVYLGGMSLVAVHNLLDPKLPRWLSWFGLLFTTLLFLLKKPLALLMVIFRPSSIRSLMGSSDFLPAFLGHFVGAGLMEELFKLLPVLILIPFSSSFLRYVLKESPHSRLPPRVLLLVGAASAIGFTLVETLLYYIPKIHSQEDLAVGLMLLVPRMITTLCGHVAWTGIFAYFVSLSSLYRRGKIKLFLIGWFLSSALHGAWNACDAVGIPILGTLIAVLSFGLFAAQLFRVRHIT